METLNTLKKKFTKIEAVKILIICILCVTVLLPLIFVLAQLGNNNISNVFINGLFGKAVFNSLLVSLITTIISMLFSFLLAYMISRSNIRFKGIFSVILTLPMLIPSIAHGMGLIIVFGENGFLTNLFNGISHIYGFWGVLLGSFMYSFPTAFLMFLDVLNYEDRTPYQMADILGIPKWRQFKDITLPYLAKPLISIFFATFTLVFTDYGVAMMVGGKFMTLPLYMYNEVLGQLNWGAGAISSIVLILPAIIACVFDLIFKDVANSNTVIKQVPNKANKFRDIITYIVLSLSFVIVAFPIVSYCLIGFFTKYPTDMTFGFTNFKILFDMGLGKFLLNSIVIAVLCSILGCIWSYFLAYLSARTKKNISNSILHIMALISLAIPGVVLGIAYSLMYRGTVFMQSIFILVLINIVHFFSSPYLMCYNAFNKINGNYEIVVKTLGISKIRYFIDILLPETENTLLEMFSYFFVNSMVTISAVSFLANAKNMPLSLLINRLEGQALLECAAIVAVFILIINVIVKTMVFFIKRGRSINQCKRMSL